MGKTMMRWVTGGLAAVMAAGGLVVPAWADDDDVKQIPTASADQWHPGWCAKGEEGYSVLIDFAALNPKDRGDLAPTASKLTDAHAKDGWLVRCHKGLEPIKTVEGDSPENWRYPVYWAAAVGIPGMVNTHRKDTEWEHRFLGITPWYGMTSNDERIDTGTLAVVPDKNGTLPSWPENAKRGHDYPGKPNSNYYGMIQKPVKGMAVAVTAFPLGYKNTVNEYFAGDDPNRSEHRPQYGEAPAPTPEPTVSPTPTAGPTADPTLTPLPTPDPEPSETTDPTPEPEQIPTASTDQWHPGWCAKDEEGYSVLIDMAALDPKDRGDLNPATTTYTDAHVKDGWFVRCHKGLEPVKYAKGHDFNFEMEPANWAASVGIPGTVDPNGWASFLGINLYSDKTSSGDGITASGVTVVPGKDGKLPGWPEKVHNDEDYPGKPADAGWRPLPEKPVKGMAVAIALYPDGHADDPENPGTEFYFAGDNPNRPEHRPQYADAPAPTPEPTPTVVPTPTVSPTPTASPTGTPTPTGTVTPTLTPLPTPDTKPSRTTTPAPNASVNPPDSTVRPVDGRDGRGDAEIPAVPGPDGGSLAAPALPATGA